MTNQVLKVKIRGIVVFLIATALTFFVIRNLKIKQVDKGLILNIIGSTLLGFYGFPLYQGLRPSSTSSIKGTIENARALSTLGITLFLLGFILQLSFISV